MRAEFGDPKRSKMILATLVILNWLRTHINCLMGSLTGSELYLCCPVKWIVFTCVKFLYLCRIECRPYFKPFIRRNGIFRINHYNLSYVIERNKCRIEL